jgi:uncharacterized membrane protein
MLSVLLGLAAGSLRLWQGGGLTALALVAYRLYAGWQFVSGSIHFILYPVLAMVLTFFAIAIARYLVEERERQKVTRIFGQYVKPEIVAELVAS